MTFWNDCGKMIASEFDIETEEQSMMRILAIGDVVGAAAVEYLNRRLWDLRKTEKIDFVDCFLAFDEEDGVQEIYSTTFKNKSSLSEDDFYKALTNQCDVEELDALRYEEFN